MTTPRPMSAPDYGRSLTGLGFSLIVNDFERSLHFVTQVLEGKLLFRTEVFAALKLCGRDLMLHEKSTYRGNALYGTLITDAPRGVGVELQCYNTDPDAAEARARQHGYTVLAGAMDKPHGLRECIILDDEGFAWVPSRHLPKETDAAS